MEETRVDTLEDYSSAIQEVDLAENLESVDETAYDSDTTLQSYSRTFLELVAELCAVVVIIACFSIILGLFLPRHTNIVVMAVACLIIFGSVGFLSFIKAKG